MPTVVQHLPGAPCWFELSTSHQNGAKQFYAKLFGWSINDIPMGPETSYTMFQIDGQDLAAACTMMPDQAAAGVPPHWLVYFHTPDINASAAKAAELGAATLLPPLDVFAAGKIAVFKDPTGAVFALFQPMAHQGAGVMGENNTVCWCELITPDPAKAMDFYSALFGWTFAGSQNSPVPYNEFIVAGQHRMGGIMELTADFGPMPPNWGIYYMVDDCDAKVQQLTALGGKACHDPFDAPGVGRIAICADPQGAVFNLIKLNMPMA